MANGKKYKAALARVDRNRRYKVEEAMKLVKETATKKFDETVDAAINLGVDPKHADQVVRGAVVLPHGMGKAVKLAVFAKGDKAREAQEAGADIVGAEDLAEKIQGGFMDFDKVIATAASMSCAFRSGAFISAISTSCLRVTLATLSRLGAPEPLAIFAARLSSTAAGGVRSSNVNERSE